VSEYLSKKAVLEWFGLMHLEYSHNAAVSEFIESGIEIFESGAFDAPEMEHINAYWAREGLIKHQEAEIQRLRAAAVKLHVAINSYWQGDCEKADVVAAQSKLCDAFSTSTGAERAQREAERLREELDKLIEALRWYADEDTHMIKRRPDGDYAPIVLDHGQRARDILKEIGVTVE
jgi:hypothetical protein